MAKYGMAIDLNKCNQCGACVTACKVENNLQIVSKENAANGRVMQWLKLSTISYDGNSPDIRPDTMPALCVHCDDPPCIKVCPVRATYIRDDGIVAQNYPQCIGCRYCMTNCPYNVKVFNWLKEEQPVEYAKCFNTDVAVRMKGVVEKCTFCIHRLQKAKENAAAEHRKLNEEDYIPACAQVCPSHAFTFGDLDDPNSAVSKLRGDYRKFVLQEDLGTLPKVFYLKAKSR